MVLVKFVDGTEESYETIQCSYFPWKFVEKERCFLIPDVRGDVEIPREFVKSIQHIEYD